MAWFILAAFLELTGCYALWLWLREQRSPWWALASVVALLGFAWALTRSPAPYAGRTFAAYAGVYLLGALLWLRVVDQVKPDPWDLLGAGLSLAGALLILYAPRGG